MGSLLRLMWVGIVVLGLSCPFSAVAAALVGNPFVIQVIDDSTGRGVPLVELRSVHQVSWWTDNAGVVAIHEPGLMGRDVFLHIFSPGYTYPADGFGYRGREFRLTPGSNTVVRLKRTQIAERLYRLTGEGLFRDSLLAGLAVPWKEPLLNAEVLGQDSVVAVPFAGGIRWFWGDTDRLSYPLGHFGSSGAVSALPGGGGLDPALGVDLRYYTNADGFAKPVCRIPGEGLKWIESVFVIPDESGVEQLYARVANQKSLAEINDWHLMRWDETRQEFQSIQRWDDVGLGGHDVAHPFRAKTGGIEQLYLYPNFRVSPNLDAVRDLGKYEAFTCLEGDGQWKGVESGVERDGQGRVMYRWKRGAARLHSGRIQELVRAGKLKSEETWYPWVGQGEASLLEAGRNSVGWNAWLNRWLMIFAGKPGEVWCSAADTPTGPWSVATRIATHERYNFYNPTQHSFFDQEGGRIIYIEGTYTAAFSAARTKTPRYDYNQMMYRLDLGDERLRLPVAVYRVGMGVGAVGGDKVKDRYMLAGEVRARGWWGRVKEVAFWVMPNLKAGQWAGQEAKLLAVDEGEGRLWVVGSTDQAGLKFLGWSVTKADERENEKVDGMFRTLYRRKGGTSVGRQEVGLESGPELEPWCRVWSGRSGAATWTGDVSPK